MRTPGARGGPSRNAEYRKGVFRITTDPAQFDRAAIHTFLTRSYWAEGIPRETVERSIEGSLGFALFEDGHQIGFARVITDRATYGYLADVYVLESHRGRGLGIWLVECVCAHPDLQGLRRWNLATRDAHGLYRKFGFEALRAPDRYMEKVVQNPYRGGAAS